MNSRREIRQTQSQDELDGDNCRKQENGTRNSASINDRDTQQNRQRNQEVDEKSDYRHRRKNSYREAGPLDQVPVIDNGARREHKRHLKPVPDQYTAKQV